MEEFPFDKKLFGYSRSRIYQTRAETRREQSIQWNRMKDISSCMKLKEEQEKDSKIQNSVRREDVARVKKKQGLFVELGRGETH